MVLLVHCGTIVVLLILLHAGTRSRWREDKAKDPLFTFVRPEVLQRPTIKKFIRLLDNYETSTGATSYTFIYIIKIKVQIVSFPFGVQVLVVVFQADVPLCYL